MKHNMKYDYLVMESCHVWSRRWAGLGAIKVLAVPA
jgi:hypothetical protein